MNYIRKSKNQKLKTQIFDFLSRIFFGSHRLGLSGKLMLLCQAFLLVFLFFPWMRLTQMDGREIPVGAFSAFTGYLGYGIIISIGLVMFFLLSHSKKEHLRSYVPFRLSDAQAIVFIVSMMCTAVLHFLFMSVTFHQFASGGVDILFPFHATLFVLVGLLVLAYFYSRHEKVAVTDMHYLDKRAENPFGEYEEILGYSEKKDDQKNMSLPI